MHSELTWWVWSLGSSTYRLGNYSWTTRHSLESLLLRTDLSRVIFDFVQDNLSLMSGAQIFFKNYALVRSCSDGSGTRVANHSPSMSTMLSQGYTHGANSGRG
jgi:hypothetical protein